MTVATWTLPTVLAEEHSDAAAALLRRYFEVGADGQPLFTGAMFERFEGGGDRPEVADRVTTADLVAVSMLSVDVPAAAALRLLHDNQQQYLTKRLVQLPVDIDLADATDDHVQIGEELWTYVRQAGVGPVTTSKLLARKRPRLLPVIDSVVKTVLHHPRNGDFYRTLQHRLAADDRALHRHLEKVRELAGVGPDISVLRCFDIVVWLYGRHPDSVSPSESS